VWCSALFVTVVFAAVLFVSLLRFEYVLGGWKWLLYLLMFCREFTTWIRIVSMLAVDSFPEFMLALVLSGIDSSSGCLIRRHCCLMMLIFCRSVLLV
jgi:hypothetical protein